MNAKGTKTLFEHAKTIRWMSCLFLAAEMVLCASATCGQPIDRATKTPDFGSTSRIQYHIGFAEFAPATSTNFYDTFRSAFYFGRASTSQVGSTLILTSRAGPTSFPSSSTSVTSIQSTT